jgi:hypothetical protein
VAEIYKTLFGIKGSNVDLAAAEPPGGHPTVALPTVAADGTIKAPATSGGSVKGQADRSPEVVPALPPFRREDQMADRP